MSSVIHIGTGKGSTSKNINEFVNGRFRLVGLGRDQGNTAMGKKRTNKSQTKLHIYGAAVEMVLACFSSLLSLPARGHPLYVAIADDGGLVQPVRSPVLPLSLRSQQTDQTQNESR